MPERDVPNGVDEYVCSGFRVSDWIGNETVYIKNFQVHANGEMLHHMVVHACGPMNRNPGDVWYVSLKFYIISDNVFYKNDSIACI